MARDRRDRHDDAADGVFGLAYLIAAGLLFGGGGALVTIVEAIRSLAWQALVWTFVVAVFAAGCWSVYSFVRTIPEMFKFVRELRMMYREASRIDREGSIR